MFHPKRPLRLFFSYNPGNEEQTYRTVSLCTFLSFKTHLPWFERVRSKSQDLSNKIRFSADYVKAVRDAGTSPGLFTR